MEQMIGNFRWAILLCQFSDATPSLSKHHFEALFSQQGTSGLRDYWRDVSHGFMNIDGSDVYGWRSIDMPLADFGKLGRDEKVRVAAAAFSTGQEGVDFPKYFGIMVIHDQTGMDGGSPYGHQSYTLNGVTKLYAGVVGNITETQCFFAHEMGHGFGLDHSFDDSKRTDRGEPGEYFDEWDIMSAEAVMSFVPPGNLRFRESGPILNASNMRDIGWLDSRRVQQVGVGNKMPITLSPLSRPDLNGFVAAFVDPYWIEFRIPAGWDAGIGKAVVLVHTGNNRIDGAGNQVRMSVLQASREDSNVWALEQGDTFERDSPASFSKYFKIDVVNIDLNPANPTANLEITHHAPPRVPQEGILAWILEGFLAVTPNGKIERIPPHSPLRDILVGAVIYQLAQELEDTDQKADLQRYSMNLIQQVAQKARKRQ